MSQRGTIKRYTLILEKIKGGQFPNMEEVLEVMHGQGFEVSRRTVERDFEVLRDEFGVEITYDKSKKGYFIDFEESFDLDSFLRFLGLVNTAHLLTDSLKESKETLQYIDFDQSSAMKGVDFLADLLRATRNHQLVRFAHYSYDTKKVKTFKVEPYLLKEYQNRWYLVGMVRGLKELRTFGIDRIEKLDVLSDSFTPDQTLNPKAKFREVVGLVYSINELQEVILSFTPKQGEYIKRLPMHHSQTVLIDNDEEFQIQLMVRPNYELQQQILMHHSKVKVIAPQWLRDEIVMKLKQGFQFYE